MIKKPNYLSFLLLAFIVQSCMDTPQKITEISTIVQDTLSVSQQLNLWFEAQFQKDISASPMGQAYLGIKTEAYGEWDDISTKSVVEKHELNKQRLAYLKDSVTVASLTKETALSYELYKHNLENSIEGFAYRLYDYPVNQMFGTHTEVPSFLINIHTIDSITDANAYISRLQGVGTFFNALIENLRIREKNGIMPPKFVYSKVIEECQNICKGRPFDTSNEDSDLWVDFSTKVNALPISDLEKRGLQNQAAKALKTVVAPAYDTLIAFLEKQQKRATDEDGVWKFPRGEAYYEYALRNTTTTKMSAEEIHELGIKEVARIHKEMKTIIATIGYQGTLQDFFTYLKKDTRFYYPNDSIGKAAYLKEAVRIIDTMRSKLDTLFHTQPKAAIVVKPVESFREKTAGIAFYQRGTADGTRPGVYYVNLYDMNLMAKYEMEALAYHEGIPGHHMQISIAQELKDIPKFRKYGGYTAYVEGWGLYTELLPKEIGMYTDPYSDFGRLSMELWRACRLVVDTGIHVKRWTREEAITYYKSNTPNAAADAIRMVERHIVLPSQATAYKIGMNTILRLRQHAKKTLGTAFDIREFHDVVLTNGAVPLTVLEALIIDWIQVKQQQGKEPKKDEL